MFKSGNSGGWGGNTLASGAQERPTDKYTGQEGRCGCWGRNSYYLCDNPLWQLLLHHPLPGPQRWRPTGTQGLLALAPSPPLPSSLSDLPVRLHTDVGEWPRAWGNEDPGVPVPRVQKGFRIGPSGSQPGPQFPTKRGNEGEQWLGWRAASWGPPPLSSPLPGSRRRGPFKRPARLRQPPRPPPPGPPLPAAPSAGRAGVRPERAGPNAAPGKAVAAGTRAAREPRRGAAVAMG